MVSSWKVFSLWSVLALPLFTMGCGGGSDDDDDTIGDGDADADSDADGDADNDDPTDGDEKVFVADVLAIGEPTEGFDLDDHTTEDNDDPVGCGKVDGPGGVDNQLSPLVDGIVQGAGLDANPNELLLESIQDGSLLLLARLVDVDDGTSDPRVPLYFYLGDDADADVTNNLTGDGEFLVSPSSLEGATLEDAVIRFDEGSLVGGLYDTPPSIFRLTVPLDDQGLELDLAIQRAQIVFRYSDSGLTEGIVGGYVDNEAILDALQNLDLGDVEIPVQLVRTVLAAQADIDAIPPGPTTTVCTGETVGDDCQPGQRCCPPSAADEDCVITGCPGGESCQCIEPDGRCDALSLGLRFSAVPAAISGISPL
jgi:hypothetical protein